jgi:hypothetical protein
MKKIVLAMCLLFNFTSARTFYEDSLNFTDEEIQSSSLGFAILGGTIKVDKMGGIADGTYQLEEWEIEQLDNQQYQATLFFQKKKGIINYSHTEKIGILLSNNQLWVKYQENIYRYKKPHQHYNPQKNILDIAIGSMKITFELMDNSQ